MARPMSMQSADMRRAEMPPATAVTHAPSRALTTPPGWPGPNSWPGWARRFRWSARGVVATSGSEETAGRSRLTSNRRFASERRPGWLRPHEVRSSRTSANRSNRRPTSCPTSISIGSDGIPCHGADGTREEGFQGRSASTRKIQPQAWIRSSSAPRSERRIQPSQPRLLLLVMPSARPTLAEVALADLTFRVTTGYRQSVL